MSECLPPDASGTETILSEGRRVVAPTSVLDSSPVARRAMKSMKGDTADFSLIFEDERWETVDYFLDHARGLPILFPSNMETVFEVADFAQRYEVVSLWKDCDRFLTVVADTNAASNMFVAKNWVPPVSTTYLLKKFCIRSMAPIMGFQWFENVHVYVRQAIREAYFTEVNIINDRMSILDL